MVADDAFGDLALAALYDSLNPWGPADDFYLDLVMKAGSVLDVGCGTGQLVRRARAEGHTGRLMGLDPAAAMLVQARRAAQDVEWVLGDMRTRLWQREFELVVMTGHAFQALVGDEDIRVCLRGVHAALADGGRFVFETRNPAARAWEKWTPDRVREITAADGSRVRVRHQVREGPSRGRVHFTETYESETWPAPRVTHHVIRFVDAKTVRGFLEEAGLTVVEQYGDWQRGPLAPAGPEIVTVARRSC
ncbi:class I SAM-dependent methyltransferase [Streptomyces collinus]|uniref:Methyltransferase n=1 Tax=Streptomyces collinus (strain DSM 40733 / Tue 365) TaxID=1214242 RepID=S5VM31_STRC3|nr:methyltransferase [Streptomyces collinus Tu 365]UJA10257.1 class I SAM-dependent methyltransferase [Streptomyces collinus]UJA14879.1 class I SAM-dependent methyltransferase [Streptomyces collinus]